MASTDTLGAENGGQSVPQLTLGERLRKARADAGFEQVDLGHRLGYESGSNLSRWERNKGEPPRPETVVAWAHFTGCPLWWLAGDDYPELGGRRVTHGYSQPELWTTFLPPLEDAA